MQGIVFYFILNILLTSVFIITNENRIKSISARQKVFYQILLFIAFFVYVISTSFIYNNNDCTGNDTHNYIAFFRKAKDYSLLNYLLRSGFEPGFSLMSWLISRFTHDAHWLYIITNSIIFLGFSSFVRKLQFEKLYFGVVACIFIICSNMLLSICLLRTVLAMSICLFSYQHLRNRQFGKALIWALFATSMHVSSIIIVVTILLIWFIDKMGLKSIKNRLIALFTLAILEIPISTMLTRYVLTQGRYVAYQGTHALAVNTYLTIVILLIMILYKQKKVHNVDLANQFDIDYITCVFLCLPLQLYSVMAYRMVLLFMPIVYMNMGKIYSEFRKNKTGRLTWDNFAILSFITFYLIYKIKIVFWDEFRVYGLYPYIFEWFNID